MNYSLQDSKGLKKEGLVAANLIDEMSNKFIAFKWLKLEET